MQNLFAVLGTALALASFAPYIVDILHGRTRPHIYTYLIWSIVTTLVFIGQIQSGAGVGALVTGAVVLLLYVVFVLCFKYGTRDITSFDTTLLALALLAIIPWWFMEDPIISVILATSISVLAFVPTVRKLWRDAESENLLSWTMNIARHASGLGALASYSIATYLYPLVHLFMSALVVGIILGRGRKGG